MVPHDTWEITSQNKIWSSDIKSQSHWLALLFFQKPDCFSPNEQKNQLPLVDFISAATVFVCLQYPLETQSRVSCSCFKEKKKYVKAFLMQKQEEKVGGGGGERGPQGTRINSYKDI